MRSATSDSGLLAGLLDEGYDFFTGVPDSGLKNFIEDAYRLPSDQHVPATWEAEAVAIAAGASRTPASVMS
jgi:sulfopyruvate decarboxylase TPP-binding subunit